MPTEYGRYTRKFDILNFDSDDSMIRILKRQSIFILLIARP